MNISVTKFLEKINTEELRERMIEQLRELMDIAHKHSVDEELSVKERQNWARLEAYIAQTLNSIINDYDISNIKKKLNELKKLAEELDL
ncbi:MAG: hypothetical protein DRZ76_04550 [Candidatus Nealsonbacteria bacterium]|nr:MAG: hypothetical protein DRZ76_04550 [Candidatus Nealsonbacteria bacterium]